MPTISHCLYSWTSARLPLNRARTPRFFDGDVKCHAEWGVPTGARLLPGGQNTGVGQPPAPGLPAPAINKSLPGCHKNRICGVARQRIVLFHATAGAVTSFSGHYMKKCLQFRSEECGRGCLGRYAQPPHGRQPCVGLKVGDDDINM